jgi:hypothetical protein
MLPVECRWFKEYPAWFIPCDGIDRVLAVMQLFANGDCPYTGWGQTRVGVLYLLGVRTIGFSRGRLYGANTKPDITSGRVGFLT